MSEWVGLLEADAVSISDGQTLLAQIELILNRVTPRPALGPFKAALNAERVVQVSRECF